MPALNMRLSAPRVLIDINAVTGLAGIELRNDRVTIGALTRHREVERSNTVAAHLPLLHQAMPHVAHVAIRNRGTFGGSIAFADPAAELPACTLALEATFRIASAKGERSVAPRDFFTGLYETALKPGEVLVAGEFRVAAPGDRSHFQELARRHGDYPIVGLAARARVTDGRLSGLRLAFFGAGPTPLLANEASAILESAPVDPDLIRSAQAALQRDVDPFGDAVSSAATRLHLARVLLGRAASHLSGAST